MEPETVEHNAVKIGDLLKNLSANKCEKCGYGYRLNDCSWCLRCMEICARKGQLTPKKVERTIYKLVGSLYIDATLETLDDTTREKLLGLDYGQDVFMFGAVGTGKTYAMAALLRHYVYEGFECQRINFDDFCVEVRSTMSPAAKKTEWELIKPLKEVDKLFIDDLGLRSKQETDFAYVTLYSILNKRQERRLPTFISSNKNIEKLGQQFDARIASRLKLAEVIEMTGQDRRLKGSE